MLEHAVAAGLPTADLTCLGHPDRLIEFKARSAQLADAGIDAAGVVRAVRQSRSSRNPRTGRSDR